MAKFLMISRMCKEWMSTCHWPVLRRSSNLETLYSRVLLLADPPGNMRAPLICFDIDEVKSSPPFRNLIAMTPSSHLEKPCRLFSISYTFELGKCRLLLKHGILHQQIKITTCKWYGITIFRLTYLFFGRALCHFDLGPPRTHHRGHLALYSLVQ
jgi:hypothetical protein